MQNGKISRGCAWGNAGVKFSILVLYEALSATVSLTPGWGRESEVGSGSRLYRPMQLQHEEV